MKNLVTVFHLVFVLTILISGCSEKSENNWQRIPPKLPTRWTEKVNPDNAWKEYPRPQLVRKEWLNLNGIWKFAITGKDSLPDNFSENILVPFPVESALSGVGKTTGSDNRVWYKRTFQIPKKWIGNRILLHFEASDWETTVWIDDHETGNHRGGFDPFSFDITDIVCAGVEHEIMVSVWDPTDDGFQPRGKQVKKPGGIFYTSSTGIWQTVWLEPVPISYISDFTLVPDIDNSMLVIDPRISDMKINDKIEIQVSEGGKTIFSGKFPVSGRLEIPIAHPKLWTPDQPFLYDLKMELVRDEKALDEVDSYFGMRKISLQKDDNGITRLALNNEIFFQNGPLDQGFWSDGIYTPPTDEAMRYDIEKTKEMGFNMLRKHVKVENRRFYSWCDKLGIVVWQDMPSAKGYVPPGADDLNPIQEQKEQFETELVRMIRTHFNYPSIVMWVPFNEGWGQYDTKRIAELVKQTDSTRLVNNASGWEDRRAGDVQDIHHYPEPRYPKADDDRASVLGEFGGLGLYVPDHSWQKENWGYEKMQSINELLTKFEDFYRSVDQMRDSNGLAACVYTQTTDVETETNGLMTYDRYEVKMGIENVRNAITGIIPPRLKSGFTSFIESDILELIAPDPAAEIYFTLDGTAPSTSSEFYNKPVIIDKSVHLQAICRWQDGKQSRAISYYLEKTEPLPSVQMGETQTGLNVQVYEGNWEILPEFEALKPITIGKVRKIDLSQTPGKELFGLVFNGFLAVPETDVYVLYLLSDDGSRLFIHGKQVIDYDGIHGAGERKATIALSKGLHPFRLIYFQRYGGLDLILSWESRTMQKSEIGENFWKCK